MSVQIRSAGGSHVTRLDRHLQIGYRFGKPAELETKHAIVFYVMFGHDGFVCDPFSGHHSVRISLQNPMLKGLTLFFQEGPAIHFCTCYHVSYHEAAYQAGSSQFVVTAQPPHPIVLRHCTSYSMSSQRLLLRAVYLIKRGACRRCALLSLNKRAKIAQRGSQVRRLTLHSGRWSEAL